MADAMNDADSAELAQELGLDSATWHRISTHNGDSFAVTPDSAAVLRDRIRAGYLGHVDITLADGSTWTTRAADVENVFTSTPAGRRQDYARDTVMDREESAFKKAHKPPFDPDADE